SPRQPRRPGAALRGGRPLPPPGRVPRGGALAARGVAVRPQPRRGTPGAGPPFPRHEPARPRRRTRAPGRPPFKGVAARAKTAAELNCGSTGAENAHIFLDTPHLATVSSTIT